MLNNSLKKDYPDIVVEMYVLRRSKFVHLGLDMPLNKIPNSEQFVEHIENYWNTKKQNDKINSYLISCRKWKYDYIIFEKNY